MKLTEFKNCLLHSPDHELRFVFPDGGHIEPHAHITEVGRIEKRFIDCGGTFRSVTHCSLQAWVADDVDHRLSPARLASIIDLAAPILSGEDLDVEIEYQDGLISQFPVESATVAEGELLFHLTTKNTDCLAKERCGMPATENGESCFSNTGCC
jgi:hypothetical protein